MRRGQRRGKMGATMEIAQEFVENLLFVAVSGLLFLIVVIGAGSELFWAPRPSLSQVRP